MAINYDDFLVHIKKSGQKLKKFKCTCDKCGADRGYLPKAKANKVCHRCKTSDLEYRQNLTKAIKAVRSTEESRLKTKQQMQKMHSEKRFKKKMLTANKKANPNWWRTDEWKAKISASVARNPNRCNAGLTLTEEQKIKISCSIRGISLDDFSGFSKDTTQFKLAHTLRCRIGAHLKKNKTKKNGSAVKDLGCSISELKIHLESKFESWMTWDNYGRFSKNRETWNVDHIKPLSSFNLSDPIQFKQACHYTNLQPMQAYENSVTKSDTINYV